MTAGDIFLGFCNKSLQLATIKIKGFTLRTQEFEHQFEKQISEHARLLHKVCHLYAYSDADREDLFQEIVLQLWQAYPKFEGKAKFSTWLYRVAINTAITGLRKKKDFVTSYEPANLPANISDDNSSHGTEERLQQLYKAIGQLNEVERAIVMLYMEERSYEEMEEILGISNSTLRVKMNRIKEKLRHLTKIIDYGT
jgi:RNA polymerase sigma factor (sigma-70 family)